MSKHSISKNIMKKNDIKKATNCSKYCLSVIYNEKKGEDGIFKKTIKKIEKIRKKK
jgi:hypothetical protein